MRPDVQSQRRDRFFLHNTGKVQLVCFFEVYEMSAPTTQNGLTRRENGAEMSSKKKEQQLPPQPQPSSSSSAPSSHWTLMVVFLSLLVDLLGFTVILPLIPSMLEYYSKNDKVFGFSPLWRVY